MQYETERYGGRKKRNSVIQPRPALPLSFPPWPLPPAIIYSRTTMDCLLLFELSYIWAKQATERVVAGTTDVKIAGKV